MHSPDLGSARPSGYRRWWMSADRRPTASHRVHVWSWPCLCTPECHPAGKPYVGVANRRSHWTVNRIKRRSHQQPHSVALVRAGGVTGIKRRPGDRTRHGWTDVLGGLLGTPLVLCGKHRLHCSRGYGRREPDDLGGESGYQPPVCLPYKPPRGILGRRSEMSSRPSVAVVVRRFGTPPSPGIT